MRYLLDTNVLIAAIAKRHRGIQQLMIDRKDDLGLSAIVLHELFFGAFKSDLVDQNLDRIEALGLPILAFDREDARVVGEIRAMLKRRGTPIGPYDMLIAGQALARGLTLITANVSEFMRVDGLEIENWAASGY